MAFYIVTHRQFDKPSEQGYYSIQAGAAKGRLEGMDFYDDSGINISEKNASYCELTALYWLWKHNRDEWIGITHYRRFFGTGWDDSQLLSPGEAKELLDHCDLILPQLAILRKSVERNFLENAGYKSDLEILRSVISDRSPNTVPVFDEYMKGHRTSYKNMLVCRKSLYDEYCAWLFPLLEETEKHIDLSGYDVMHQRIYGHYGERLLNVWARQNHLNVRHLYLVEKDRSYMPGAGALYRTMRCAAFRRGRVSRK